MDWGTSRSLGKSTSGRRPSVRFSEGTPLGASALDVDARARTSIVPDTIVMVLPLLYLRGLSTGLPAGLGQAARLPRREQQPDSPEHAGSRAAGLAMAYKLIGLPTPSGGLRTGPTW